MKAMRFVTLAAVFLAVMSLFSHSARAQYWQTMGGGTPGWAYATCIYNGQPIAGGEFGIMAWNGANWSPVGGNVSGQVWALTVHNDQLWAGGSFFSAGGVPVSYIAYWDGATWNDPEGGADGLVRTLTSWNGLLIAGGYFTTMEFPANHIAAWNGSTWSALGAGTGGTQGQVMALSTYNNELIAGGFFTTAGGMPASHIAKWNGASWSTLGSGVGGIVYALTNYGGNLIAGGLFSSAGGIPAQNVAQWNGSSWAPLGSGIGGSVYGYCLGLAANGNNLCAGGMYSSAGGASASCIALWNGSSWYSNMQGGMFNSGATIVVYSVSPYQYGFVAGGIFSSAGGVGSANVAQWVEAPAAQFDITLTPASPPIVIPATGGSFDYNATIANLSGSTQSTQVWIMVQLPNLSWYGPVLGPVSLTLPGGGLITRLRSQSVPATAPAGLYTYRGYLGTFPSTKIDSSSFTFTKSANGDGGWIGEWANSGQSFDAESKIQQAPTVFRLEGAFPNPFNPSTTIRFALPEDAQAKLIVYDIGGHEVATLVNGYRAAGSYQATFDATQLSAGIYVCALRAGNNMATGKMALVK